MVRRFLACAAGRDFTVLLGDRVLRLVLGFVVAGVVARYLGPEKYGWLSYASAIAAVGTILAQLGLDGVLVRELVRRPDERDELLGSAVTLRLATGLLVAGLIAGVAPLLSDPDGVERTLIAVAGLGALTPVLTIPALWFQSKTESRVATMAGMCGFIFGALGRVLLVFWQADVLAFAWLALAESAVVGLITFSLMNARGTGYRRPRAAGQLLSLVRESWPLLVGGLGVVLSARADAIIIQWIIGPSGVGTYSAAVRLSEAMYGIPMIVAVSLMAGLTEAHGPESRIRPTANAYLKLSAALGYTLIIGGVCGGIPLLVFLFGPSFAGIAGLAAVHLFSVVFVCLNVAKTRIYVVLGLAKQVMRCEVLGCVLNVALNLTLVPAIGLYGAAVSAVVSIAFSSVVMTFFVKETRWLGEMQLKAIVRPSFRSWIVKP